MKINIASKERTKLSAMAQALTEEDFRDMATACGFALPAKPACRKDKRALIVQYRKHERKFQTQVAKWIIKAFKVMRENYGNHVNQ